MKSQTFTCYTNALKNNPLLSTLQITYLIARKSLNVSSWEDKVQDTTIVIVLYNICNNIMMLQYKSGSNVDCTAKQSHATQIKHFFHYQTLHV